MEYQREQKAAALFQMECGFFISSLRVAVGRMSGKI
jgi:hypothetical protein